MPESAIGDEPNDIERLARDGWPDLRHVWNRWARGLPIIESSTHLTHKVEITTLTLPPSVSMDFESKLVITATIQTRDTRESHADIVYVRTMDMLPDFVDITGKPHRIVKAKNCQMELEIDGTFGGEIVPEIEKPSFALTDKRKISPLTDVIGEDLAEEYERAIKTKPPFPGGEPYYDKGRDAIIHTLPPSFKPAMADLYSMTTPDDLYRERLEGEIELMTYDEVMKEVGKFMATEKGSAPHVLTDSELRDKLRAMMKADRARDAAMADGRDTYTSEEAYKREYMAELRKREYTRLRDVGKHGPLPTATPRPSSMVTCSVNLNRISGKLTCRCWSGGRQWCAAMETYMTSPHSTALATFGGYELESLSKTGSGKSEVVVPIVPGYCFMRIKLGHRSNGAERVPGVVVLSDGSNPDLTIDLNAQVNEDSLDVAMRMFRNYYMTLPEFAKFQTTIQKIHNFHSSKDAVIRTANRVHKNPFGCISPNHGLVADRNLMNAVLNPPHGASLEGIVLGNVYSIRAARVCANCNADNYDYTADVP